MLPRFARRGERDVGGLDSRPSGHTPNLGQSGYMLLARTRSDSSSRWRRMSWRWRCTARREAGAPEGSGESAQRAAALSVQDDAVPALVVSHGPPKPVHRVLRRGGLQQNAPCSCCKRRSASSSTAYLRRPHGAVGVGTQIAPTEVMPGKITPGVTPMGRPGRDGLGAPATIRAEIAAVAREARIAQMVAEVVVDVP